jgi:hypothetical protein
MFRSNGFDNSLIDFNLAMTPEERIINHQRALDTVNELRQAGENYYGKPHPPDLLSASKKCNHSKSVWEELFCYFARRSY